MTYIIGLTRLTSIFVFTYATMLARREIGIEFGFIMFGSMTFVLIAGYLIGKTTIRPGFKRMPPPDMPPPPILSTHRGSLPMPFVYLIDYSESRNSYCVYKQYQNKNGENAPFCTLIKPGFKSAAKADQWLQRAKEANEL